MNTFFLALALLQAPPEEEPWTVTLTLKETHCAECTTALETNLKALKATRVSIEGTSVTVELPEKCAASYHALAQALPSDLKLKEIRVSLRGVIAPRDKDLELRAKDSGQLFRLANKDDKKNDVISTLRKQLAPPAKYHVEGELVEGKRGDLLLLFALPSKAEWKDEKK